MDSSVFSAVESELYAYTENCYKLESLIEQRQFLPTLRSSSDFSERVDTGGAHSDPVSKWVESREAIDRKVAVLQVKITPLKKMLAYLREYEPETFRLFELKYQQQYKWGIVDMQMGLSEASRQRMRRRLVLKAARFLGFIGERE